MKFGRQRVGVAQRRTRESGIAAWVEAVGPRSVRLGGLLTGVGVSGAWTPVGGRSSVARGAPTWPDPRGIYLEVEFARLSSLYLLMVSPLCWLVFGEVAG